MSDQAVADGERFDKIGIFDEYATRILTALLNKRDLEKATDDDLEAVCQNAFQIARIALDLRDDYWVGIYPSPMQ